MKKIIGKRFGKLKVISVAKRVERGDNKGYKYILNCICDCGNKTLVKEEHLIAGHTCSCGCLRRKSLGMSRSKMYKTWGNIKYRCNNKKAKDYKNYGGRGITICTEWGKSFQSFYDWSIANGYKENLTIDRIDVNGNYEPTNCRWVDMKTQQRNKRNNVLLEIGGEKKCISEWCEKLKTTYYKIKKGEL